jgi:hypothetical protein
MPQTSFKISNSSKPAPKWFRKLKKGVSMILIPAAIGLLQSFGVDSLTSTKIQAFLGVGIISLFEFAEMMLANGEEYVSTTENQNESL